MQRTKKLVQSIGLAAIAAVVGCEEPSLPPPPAPPAATQPTPAPMRRPTTQQLTEAPWKTVPISVLPMTIQVPQSWDALPVRTSELFSMEGYTPSGFVEIRIASRPLLALDRFDHFLTSARKAFDDRGPKKLRFEMREYPDFRALERQYYEDRQAMLVKDNNGDLVETEAQPMKWSYLIFLKKDLNYECFELEFRDLSLAHYEKDREFLQKILSSLTNDPGKKP